MTYRVLWLSGFTRFLFTLLRNVCRNSKNVFNAFAGTILWTEIVISRHTGSLLFLSSLRRCLRGKNTGKRKKPKACANGSGERIQYVFEWLFVQQTNCIFGLEPSLRVFRLGFWADRVFHIRPFTLHLHRKPGAAVSINTSCMRWPTTAYARHPACFSDNEENFEFDFLRVLNVKNNETPRRNRKTGRKTGTDTKINENNRTIGSQYFLVHCPLFVYNK